MPNTTPVAKPFSLTLRSFESQILYFNGMYKLPIAPCPSTREMNPAPSYIESLVHKLENFKDILAEELNEVDQIIYKLRAGAFTELEFLANMADWLGDIQIYCASEMAKYGIPIQESLRIIMDSNFSKLDIDDKPIYDSRGKIEKGPRYWAPEKELEAMLRTKIVEFQQGQGKYKTKEEGEGE